MKIRTLLARFKRRLFQKAFIHDDRYPAYWIDQALGKQPAFLVQIGSNDGKTGDPFYPLLQKNETWKALFVEPIPLFFEKLKKNYPDQERFRFEQVAINQGKPMTFYWVDHKAEAQFPDLPYWYAQLGSFDKQHILKHFDGKLEPFIISQPVECISLKTLLSRNQVEKIDVLHIDAEGQDWEILSQLELERYAPSFILFEYNHLTAKYLQAARDFLGKNYFLFKLEIDLLAVHMQAGSELAERMRQRLIQTD